MNLARMSPDEIKRALDARPRAELVELIVSLAGVEPWLTPAEIAERSAVRRRDVLADLRAGKFGEYYARAENSLRVPVSAVNRWRSLFRVVPANGGKARG